MRQTQLTALCDWVGWGGVTTLTDDPTKTASGRGGEVPKRSLWGCNQKEGAGQCGGKKVCHLGSQWFNQETPLILVIWSKGSGRQHRFNYMKKYLSYATKQTPDVICNFWTGLSQRVCVRKHFYGWCPRTKYGSLCDGDGQLKRNVTLVNYDNWAIRITKASINLEGCSYANSVNYRCMYS